MDSLQEIKRQIEKEAGGYEARPAKCKNCNDTGWITTTDENGYELAEECSCRKAARIERQMQRCGLGELLEKCTVENYHATEDWQKKVKTAAVTYKGEGWFFIGGQSGSGKTHICAAIVGREIKKGTPAKYMRWREESTRLKRIAGDEEYRTEMEKLKTIKLLYIDDLFKGGTTEADIRLAFELLDQRYSRNNPTIISSELTIGEIREIDEAIAGRIKEKTEPGASLNIGGNKNRNYRFRSKKHAESGVAI